MTDTERLNFLSGKRFTSAPDFLLVNDGVNWFASGGISLRERVDNVIAEFFPDDLPVHDQIPGSEP